MYVARDCFAVVWCLLFVLLVVVAYACVCGVCVDVCCASHQSHEHIATQSLHTTTTTTNSSTQTVALKALSPGVNDPTTAVDALFFLGALVHELLIRKAPYRVRTDSEDRLLLLPKDTTYEDIIALAFDEIRIAAGKNAESMSVQVFANGCD